MIRRLSRRAFVSTLAALAASPALVFEPQSAYAQQPAAPRRIGVILIGFSAEGKEALQFRKGLQDAGYVEGRDLMIEWRPANGDYGKVPELAADLIQRKVDAIVVDGTVTTQLLKRSTSTIPVVMAVVADPVGSGIVKNLRHPDGNITGLSLMMPELSAKRLQLLKQVVPQATHVAVLWNPDTPYHPQVIQHLKAAAPSLSIQLSYVAVRTSEEFGSVLPALSRAHARALYVIDDPFFHLHLTTISELALKSGLPTIYSERHYAEVGGLMSYGPNMGDLFRRSAGYVDKILKGAKPRDLPIEQPTRFELVVNLKTAKALGITITESILLRADEVIK